MRIKCRIVIGLDVKDCIGVYSMEDSIFNIIVNKYEGICYKEMYIEKVERIVTEGECIINQQGSPTFGTLSVIIEVTAIKYNHGEIINGCQVQNVDKSGVILGSTKIAKIYIQANQIIESVTSGQYISVIVGAARYRQGSPNIAINAAFYIPDKLSRSYNLSPDINHDLLNDVLERIDIEEKKAKDYQTTNPKAWMFFDQLLYAFHKNQNIDGKMINIKDLLNIKAPIAVSRDVRINPSTPSVLVLNSTEESKKSDEIPIVNSSNSTQMMLELLENYCARLRTIHEMIEIYSTGELLENHKNIWQIIKKQKLV